MGVYLLTLGCDKNRVDGEAMGGLLREAGYEITDDAEEAEVIIVNTCGFIRDAVRESIETVLELAKYKRTGACKKLVVTGCMAQRYRDDVLKEIPEADAVLGVKEYDKILDAVRLNKKLKPTAADAGDFYKKRLLLPVSHVAHVKIAEGCNNRCTYCTIPSIRGPYRSRHFENIVAECAALVKRGARELVLVAQDTALYGVDLYGRPRLHELLDEIAAIDELVWARVMYAYPEHITPETVESIARNEKICNYLDIPVQHSHDAVLKRMGRKSNAQGLRGVIGELRNKIPGISLRTTLIVGFPGETEEEFEHLRAFVQETQFERMGVFEYSREEGTPAAKMKYRVKAGVKRERRDALMRLQQEIHREKQRALTGQDLRVMVDEAKGGDGVFLCRGRSYRDAYETDAVVSFTAKGLLSPGDVANVRITGYDDYDLSGFALE